MDGIQGHRPYTHLAGAVDPRTGGRVRVLASVVLVAFAVTLAVVVGQRLSDQAMAVLAGAVCGVGASIPTSLLIVWVTRRRQEEHAEQRPAQPPAGAYPPVIVVQQPGHSAMTGPSYPHPSGYLAPYTPPSPREFTVVGGGLEEVSHGRYQ